MGVGDVSGDSRTSETAVRTPDAGTLLWALRRIAHLTNQTVDVRAALEEALRLLCEAGGFSAGHALLARSAGRLTSAGVFVGDHPQMREASKTVEFGPGEGLVGRALERRSAAFGTGLEGDPRAAAAAAEGLRSAAVCPILIGPEVAGALELFSSEPELPEALALFALEQAAALLGRVLERSPATAPVRPGEDVFRSLCDSLPVGVILTDAEGKAAYVNPAFERVLGHGVKEINDGTWRNFVHPADRERSAAAWREAVEKAQALRIEARLLRGGKERVVVTQFSPLSRPDGSLGGHIGVVEDRTPEAHAQAALRESEDRFRAIFEDAGVGLAIGTVDGLLVRVNRAYAHFLGYEPAELAGANVERLVANELDRTMRDRRDLESRRIPRYDVERQYFRRDGTKVWGRATVTRLGETGLLVAVVQDIDARRRAEDEVRRLSGRFLQLQDEERRRIARALHESAAQTVAALSMNLQRMERMQLPPHAAETLADSLELAAQTSREIRTLSHLLHPPLLEEAGLPSSLRWYLEGFGTRSNVGVELDVSPDLGRLPTELEITLFRIVQESLTNVHRHSGSESASVRLRRVGPEVVLEVEDRGAGMPPDVLRRVREQSAGGVGVGIAGMRERLAQLGGTLEIDSGPLGTTMRARIRSER